MTQWQGRITTQSEGYIKERAIALWAAILAVAGTAFLYHDATQLPFFFDDMIHLRWLDWHSLASIWITAEGLGYYRPLTMSLWKVGYLLLGYNSPAVCHFLNLLLHALNAALVGLLGWRAYRGRGRLTYALLATLLFVSFPFSYQAVPSTSSLSKPLIATLTLSSVLLYWEGRSRRSRWLLGLSLFVALLAPFAYELGVMVPVAILATEILARSRGEFDRFSRFPALYFLLVWGLALPAVVFLEPKSGASVGLPKLLDLWQNATFFAQGLIFPVAPIATPLERALQIDRYVLLAVIGVGFLAMALLIYRWARQMSLFWYVLVWFVVGVAPLWLQLDFTYVITSPRILYLGGVSCALLWAGIPVFLWARAPVSRWLHSVPVMLVAGLLVFNSAYVRDKMNLANMVAAPLWEAAEAAKAAGSGRSLLYVNVPAWIAPKHALYRGGTEGLTFIPEYVRAQDFVYVNTGVEPRVHVTMYDPVKQDLGVYIGYVEEEWGGRTLLQQIRRVDKVYVTTYTSTGLDFVEAGSVEKVNSLAAAGPVAVNYADQILLLTHRIEKTGHQLAVTLQWYCQQTPDQDVTVFLHVYNQASQLVAQHDGYPLAGLFPAAQCQPGESILDVRHLTLPEGPSNDAYRIAVGWYNPGTGERLPARDGQGQPLVDGAAVIAQP